MPGPRCNVYLCSNYNGKLNDDGKRITFHRFPKKPELRKIWLEKCHKIGNWNVDYGYICSEHFKKDDFKRDLQAELLNYKGRRKLKPYAVPSLNLPNCSKTSSKTNNLKYELEKERYELLEDCLLNTTESIPLSFETFKKWYKTQKENKTTRNKVYNCRDLPFQNSSLKNKRDVRSPSLINSSEKQSEQRKHSSNQLKRNVVMQKKMMEKIFLATYLEEPFSGKNMDNMDDDYVVKARSALLEICALAPKSYNRFAKRLNLPSKDVLLSWNNKNCLNKK